MNICSKDPNLFGMKYPASRMMGGSMKRKNTLGVRVEGGCSLVRKSRKPMMIPTTMSRQDSGNMWCSLGVMWNPAIMMYDIEAARQRAE